MKRSTLISQRPDHNGENPPQGFDPKICKNCLWLKTPTEGYPSCTLPTSKTCPQYLIGELRKNGKNKTRRTVNNGKT